MMERLLLYMQTDRASTLDEIIEYVKLLHMQIKVVPKSLATLNFCSDKLSSCSQSSAVLQVLRASKLDSNVGSVGPLTHTVAAEVQDWLLIFTSNRNVFCYWNSDVCFNLLADTIFFRFARHQRVSFNLVAHYLRKAESLSTILWSTWRGIWMELRSTCKVKGSLWFQLHG